MDDKKTILALSNVYHRFFFLFFSVPYSSAIGNVDSFTKKRKKITAVAHFGSRRHPCSRHRRARSWHYVTTLFGRSRSRAYCHAPAFHSRASPHKPPFRRAPWPALRARPSQHPKPDVTPSILHGRITP